MSPLFKKIISILGVGVVGLLIYYGSYAPFKKSAQYIDTIQGLSNISSLKQLADEFGKSLDKEAPFGHPELVRNLGNLVTGLVDSNGQANPDIVEPLMQYIDGYYQPMLARGKGMSYGQDLYIVGTLNAVAYSRTSKSEYLEKAQAYYEQGLAMSPRRPQFLYGLLSVYEQKGDVQKAKEKAEEILSLWPEDARTRTTLEQLNASSSAQ